MNGLTSGTRLALAALAALGCVAGVVSPAMSAAAVPPLAGLSKAQILALARARNLNPPHELDAVVGNPTMVNTTPQSGPVGMPPQGTVTTRGNNQLHSFMALSSGAGTAATSVANASVDARILVISADGKEADLPAIQQALNYQGTPYDVFIGTAPQNLAGLNAATLANGSHGFYQGVILTTGTLSYTPDGQTFLSALSPASWQTLWNYEAAFHVRQVTWYTYPTSDYGFAVAPAVAANPGAVSTIPPSPPVTVNYTADGKSVFPYANTQGSLNIIYAFTYLAAALGDGSSTPLLEDGQGDALALIHTYPDGRQNLALTFDSNPSLIHDLVLAYGLVRWVTQGVFIGSRHSYMLAQPDDIFIDDNVYVPGTPFGYAPDTGPTYRITGADLNAFVNWQHGVQQNPVTRGFRAQMPYNGWGSQGNYPQDTLTPAVVQQQAQFSWLSHTYDHENLNAVGYWEAYFEILVNEPFFLGLTFTNYTGTAMVTPDISGLNNPAFLQAASDLGIRYVVTDTSVLNQPNNGPSPIPNTGFYNSVQPKIFEVPRHPTNLYYNVSTPTEWTAEYNAFYGPQGYLAQNHLPGVNNVNLTYQQVLDVESDHLLVYLLQGDLDPLMFHQPNLRAYDGKHSLLSDLMDLTFSKYSKYMTFPVESLTEEQLGPRMIHRLGYLSSGVTATIKPGQSITLLAQRSCSVELTGIKTPASENYGGELITTVGLTGGVPLVIPLQ